MNKNYAIVIERGEEGGFGAYAPDVPGCIAVGKTEKEVVERFREALAFHFRALAEDGGANSGADFDRGLRRGRFIDVTRVLERR